ncbi:MAG: GNAT family N-acetyltransferase, partial [Propioniciclava sp.]
DPAVYWPIAQPVVDRSPVLHALHASVVAAVSSDPPAYPRWTFYVGERPGAAPFLAHHTPPYPFHMPAGDAGAAERLAEFVHQAGTRPAAVGGHLTSVVAFAGRWTALTGQAVTPTLRLGIYDLPGEPALPWPVSGHPRAATAGDGDLVRGWLEAFGNEVSGHRGRRVVGDDGLIASGRTLLWCDPEPVGMAQAKPSGSSMVPISDVYTPPEHRGRGYGSAVTAAISRSRIDHGEQCMLYTDLDNPTSNSIYAALGYRFVGESIELALHDPGMSPGHPSE